MLTLSQCARTFAEKYPVQMKRGKRKWEWTPLWKAVKIVENDGVTHLGDYIFQVKSQSVRNGHYKVNMLAKTCTCPDHENGNICKHRIAVGLHFLTTPNY